MPTSPPNPNDDADARRPSDEPAPDDSQSENRGTGKPPASDDDARLMESTVDSIEEVLEETPHIGPGRAADDATSGADVGESTMPFGIDLDNIVDQHQTESAKDLDQTISIEKTVPIDQTVSLDQTVPIETPPREGQEDSPDKLSARDTDDLADTRAFEEPASNGGPNATDSPADQTVRLSDQTVRLEDTADESLLEATIQFDRSDNTEATVDSIGISQGGGSAKFDPNDIGQTVNPRELSGKDAAFWGSLLQTGTGQASRRGEVTEISPAIERSISETKLQIRVRDMATPKHSTAADSDYELVQLLGKGGMGNVFVAKQTSLDRLIAVKVIKPLDKDKREKLSQKGKLHEVEEDRRQQFLSEAVVTGDLDHPNIVPIHDIAVTADNTLFYAMKRVVGTPWSKVIDEKSRDENLDILLRVSDAIGFAHTRGVVHRDIKPENIMLGDFGVVLVMDWGLALAKPEFEKIDSISHTAGLGGTPAFMAPEMATGPIEKIGPGSDIYLLGATLFLIITGRPPHHAANITQCIKAVAKNEITGDIQSHRGELMNIALKAMAKEPQDRYPDVLAFQQAIRDYRSHAESIALAHRANEDAEQGRQQRDYTSFSRATYGYEQALSLWPGNDPARQGLQQTQIAHAEAALENEDFDLGLSLLDRDEPAHQELIEQLHDGQTERDLRQSRLTLFRRTAVAMLAFILVGGAVAFYVINDQRNQAIAARGVAITQREIAEEQKTLAEQKTREVEQEKKKVEAQRLIAEEKTEEAEANLQLAREKKIEADMQRAVADQNAIEAKQNAAIAKQNEEKAQENFAEANRQRGIAFDKAEDARREQARAEYEAYLSQIGLVKARVERNEFDDARRILSDLKDRRGSERLGWEWRWLWQQANQSTDAKRTGSAIINLDVNRRGNQGVAVGEDGSVELVGLAADGNIQSKRINLRGISKVTAAAISADGTMIAVGRETGLVELWDADLSRKSAELDGHDQTITDLHFVDANRLVSGSRDRTVRRWNVAERKSTATLWHIAPVQNLSTAIQKDGSLIIATAVADSSSGRAVVWRSQGSDSALKRIGEFSRHDQPIASIALSPDGTLAASGDIGGTVLLWKPSRLQRTDYPNAIASAIKTVGGKQTRQPTTAARLANKTPQRIARLVDPSITSRTQQLVSTATRGASTAKAHRDLIESIAFSDDGKSVLTTAHDYTIKIWNADTRDLTKTLRGHGGWVTEAAFVGDGDQRVLSVSKDTSIRSWSIDKTADDFSLTNTGRNNAPSAESTAKNGGSSTVQSQPHEDEIWSARFDPSGKQIVSASRDHTARVLAIDRETMTFREVAKLQLKEDRKNTSQEASMQGLPDQLVEGTSFRAMSAAVDRVGGRLFIGSADATVRIWDLVRGTQVGKLSGTGLNRSLSLSANGRLLLTGSSSAESKALLWGIDPAGTTPPKILYRLKGHEQAVTAFAISPDGRTLFTGDRIGIGYFWDTATGQRTGRRVEDTRGFRINDACFSPDARELLIAADDQNLTRIDVATGRRTGQLVHDGFVTQVSLSHDGRRALTISETNTPKQFRSKVTLWELGSNRKRTLDQIDFTRDNATSLSGKTANNLSGQNRFLSADFGTESKRAVISRSEGDGQPGQITVVDLGSDVAPRQLVMPRRLGSAEAAMPLPNGHLLTLNFDAGFLWDLDTMTHKKSYRAHAAVTQSGFSFDAKYIATGSRSLKIWDTATGVAVGKLESPHQGAVRSVQFRSHGPDYILATAGEDGMTRVWQWTPQNNQFDQLHEFALSDRLPVIARSVCFSSDGNQLLAVGDRGRARLWTLDTNSKPTGTRMLAAKPSVTIFDQDENTVFTCADVSADGKWIAIGGDNKKAILLSTTDPDAKPIVMEGHADQIEDIAILQDTSEEMRVLTASRDKSARLWDPRTGSEDHRGREILTLRKHRLGVTAVDVTENGDLVLTASRDGTVALWPAAKSADVNREPAKKDAAPKEQNLFDGLSTAQP